MSQQYLMAIDAGTGSVRAVIFSLDGEQTGCVQREWEHKEDPRYPGSMDFDWAHNWDLARECVQGVLKEDQYCSRTDRCRIHHLHARRYRPL